MQLGSYRPSNTRHIDYNPIVRNQVQTQISTKEICALEGPRLQHGLQMTARFATFNNKLYGALIIHSITSFQTCSWWSLVSQRTRGMQANRVSATRYSNISLAFLYGIGGIGLVYHVSQINYTCQAISYNIIFTYQERNELRIYQRLNPQACA
jgi:hypothetical protein